MARRTLAQQIEELQQGIPMDDAAPTMQAPSPDLPQSVPQLPVLPGSAMPSPDVTPPKLARPKLSDILQGKLDAASAPPTLKGSLLKAISQAAPIGIAALLGGTTGAYGASQGVQEGMATQQALATEKRKELQTQLEAEKNREERGAERESTVQAQIQGIQQRAEAASAAAKSREEVAQIRADAQRQIDQLNNQVKKQGQEGQLREKGFKTDPQGNIVPITEADMSPKQQQDAKTVQVVNALKEAQTAYQQAKTEALKNPDPNSPAALRLKVAEGNLAMRQKEFEVHAFGTVGGVQPAGGLQTESGQPIGTLFQQNVLPTAATRTKAQTADPFIAQAEDLKSFALDPANKDLFGKIGGRWTDLMAGKIGTDDPRMARLIPKIRSLASLAAPLHGFRGSNVVEDFTKSMPIVDSPQAFAAAIDEYSKTGKNIKSLGTPKTNKGGGGATHRFNPLTGKIEPIK